MPLDYFNKISELDQLKSIFPQNQLDYLIIGTKRTQSILKYY